MGVASGRESGENPTGRSIVQTPWFQDQDEVLAFARVMVDDGRIDDLQGLLYYIEKPWKWDTEHLLWIGLDSPTKDTYNWQKFSSAIQKLWFPSEDADEE